MKTNQTNQTNQTNWTNKTALLFFLSAITLAPVHCLAFEFDGTLKGVKITDASGANQPPTAVINYTNDGDKFSFDAASSTDPDGKIAKYNWVFSDGSALSGVSTSKTLITDELTATLNVIDDKGGVSVTQVTVHKPFALAINFQPKWAPVPVGYLADFGAPYTDTVGYGWRVASYKDFLDRNNASSPDQTYDTLANVYPTAVWEAKVPNGTYEVTVLVGDPTYPLATNSIQIEGRPLIDKLKTSQELKFIEKAGSFTITDGMLTMSFLDSSAFAKICRINFTGPIN